MSPEEIQRLVHELQVHQIELEKQNEELRRAQAELAESGDRFSHLYDFAPVGYVTLDHNGTVLEVNLTMATMLGVEPGNLVGRKFNRFVSRDAQDTLYLHQRAVLGSDVKQACDLHLCRADGKTFTARLETIGYRDDASGACHYRSAISDITERERAEQALRESEERYRTVVENAVHGIIIHQDNRICFANAALLRMFGYTAPDELHGHDNFEKLVAPEERPTLQARTAALYRGEHLPPHEGWRGIHKNGTDIWITTSATPIEWQGRPAIVAFYSDVTARKRAEQALTQLNASLEQQVVERTQALREREQRLHAILNTAPDAIITINAKGGIQSVNPAAAQVFGYTAAEMIGRNVKLLMPSPYQEEHDRYLANYAQTGVKRIIGIGREVVARRKNGSTFPVELTVSEVDGLNLFTGILRDITRRKELEREVVEIASLEQCLTQMGSY